MDAAFPPPADGSITYANPQSRIALVSTPRSGNTWLRRLLATALQLDELAYHRPRDVGWATLPERSILQLHWRRDDAFETLLAEAKLPVIVLSRHPFDVLVSILQFAPHTPETACWLDGAGGDESTIIGHSPAHEAFLRYGLSERAEALLEVSYQWWERADCHRVRYEDLVASPAAELDRLVSALGSNLGPGVAEQAVAANTMTALRATSTNRHFWQGSPGLWQQLIPAEFVTELLCRHEPLLTRYGYRIELPPPLAPGAAEANWRVLLDPPVTNTPAGTNSTVASRSDEALAASPS